MSATLYVLIRSTGRLVQVVGSTALLAGTVNADQLTWTAMPSPSYDMFSNRADALDDLHAFSPEHALVTTR